MGSVISSWSGHLVREAARQRLLGRLALLAPAVSPAHAATWTPVDDVVAPPLTFKRHRAEVTLTRPVRLQGGVLRLADFRGWEHDFHFTFVTEAPSPARRVLRWRLVRLYPGRPEEAVTYVRELGNGMEEWGMPGDDLTLDGDCSDPRPVRVVHPPIHPSLSFFPMVDLRYHLESEFDWLMSWIRVFHVPSLRYWRYEDDSGLPSFRKWVAGLDALPREQRTFSHIFAQKPHFRSQHDPVNGLRPDLAAALEAEGTTEALAFGTLVDVLRQAYERWPDSGPVEDAAPLAAGGGNPAGVADMLPDDPDVGP